MGAAIYSFAKFPSLLGAMAVALAFVAIHAQSTQQATTTPTQQIPDSELADTQPAEPIPPATSADAANPPQALGNNRDIHMHPTCLAADSFGRVWVGTEVNGVWCLDPGVSGESRWKHYTAAEGLGDGTISSITVDRDNRVWVGHLNHGVSVFNGQKWQTYEMAAGLSRPDSLAGPIGERIFAFAQNPVDGDIWMGTSHGLTRYSLSKDTWISITRADGLPSDQISTLDFDSAGTLFIGTQCDGIAIAKPADNYKTWTRVRGPDVLPQTPTGRGLPTNLINQILVAKNDAIYVATSFGLARSIDRGATWHYVRGHNWTRKVAMRNTPASKALPAIPPQPPYMLREDYITCLAEDADGRIFIATRADGFQRLTPPDPRDARSPANLNLATAGTLEAGPVLKTQPSGRPPPYIMSLLPLHNRVYVALYEGGMHIVNPTATYGARPTPVTSTTLPATPPPLPASALVPTVAELRALGERATALAEVRQPVVFIGDDWRTQGDWVNHYGRQYAVLGAALGPFDQFISASPAYYRVYPIMGLNRVPGDGIRRWIHSVKEPHMPYDPALGRRNETEWDDHGETYPMPIDGPDIHFQVTVPAGVSRVSIYFVNPVGRYNAERWRDYTIDVRRVPAELGARGNLTPQKSPLDSDPPALPLGPGPLAPDAIIPASWLTLPVLARARVKDFQPGVYKQFAVTGPGTFDFAVRRNYSFNTICTGVFIDRLSGPATSLDGVTPLILEGPAYEPPEARLPGDAPPSETTQAAIDLWKKLDAAQANPSVQALDYPARVLAYRALGNKDPVAENWRWQLRLWSPQDRTRFEKAMADIWQYQMLNYPELHQGVQVQVK